MDDELRKLGIVNIRYASQDAQGDVVLPLANRTVTKVEPAPRAVMSVTDTVLITATKTRAIAPQPTRAPAIPTAGREAPTRSIELPNERTTVQREPVEPDPDSGDNSNGSGGEVYYKNCNAAKAAGAAPLKSGQPGYRPELDRDKDGTACDE